MKAYLENVRGKHYKFYKIYCYAYHNTETGKDDSIWVTCNWGRIGVNGQVQHHKFYARWSALDFFEKKVREKLDKGYDYAVQGERPPERPHWRGGVYNEIADLPKANEEFVSI